MLMLTFMVVIPFATAGLEADTSRSVSVDPPASWPAYAKHSCHAVGPNARVIKLKNATHAQYVKLFMDWVCIAPNIQ